MVQGVRHKTLFAQKPRQGALRFERHAVRGFLHRSLHLPHLMVEDAVLIAEFRSDVLDKRSAERDVGNLHSAADPQRRNPSCERVTHEGQLIGVACRVEFADAQPIVPIVERGSEIPAAAEEQARKSLAFHRSRIEQPTRKNHRAGAGAFEQLGMPLRLAAVVGRRRRVFPSGRNPDNRPHHGQSLPG